VRQKICFERASALALPLLLKKEERAGERRHFLSVSPLSDSLPARSSRGERAKPRKRFACRTQLVVNLPTAAREQRSADYKSAIRQIKNLRYAKHVPMGEGNYFSEFEAAFARVL